MGCPFCYEWLPKPTTIMTVFTGGGALGGNCTECGAFFVFEESGRLGGQATMDLQAMAADGDLDRALTLRPGIDCEIRKKHLNDGERGRNPTSPKVWALKMGPPVPKLKPKPRRVKDSG